MAFTKNVFDMTEHLPIDGSTDDMDALNTLINANTFPPGAELQFPPIADGANEGYYTCKSLLTVPDNAKFKITGTGKIRKLNDCDMILLGRGSTIGQLKLIAGNRNNSEQWGGGVIVISSGTLGDGNQAMFHTEILGSTDFCIKFTLAQAGYDFRGIGLIMERYDYGDTIACVQMPVLSAMESGGTREFVGCLCYGNAIVETQSSQNTGIIGGSSKGGALTHPNTHKLRIVGHRCADDVTNIMLYGQNLVVVGNVVVGEINLGAGLKDSRIGPNVCLASSKNYSGNFSNSWIY